MGKKYGVEYASVPDILWEKYAERLPHPKYQPGPDLSKISSVVRKFCFPTATGHSTWICHLTEDEYLRFTQIMDDIMKILTDNMSPKLKR